eukprot:TRINITY_DN781897_c0_g1_i1.p1 TRINITY_DN781897_c0_g1~~TRINITY_DN781897_c0_g1_i1.p1  ORF type:complete len:685 (+),score=21.38 TRINITY_DN781897_c0_g1_i1:560-2614(+)
MIELFKEPNGADTLTFRRWGRKSYSLFQAMNKQVKIAVLLVSYITLSIPENGFAQTSQSDVSMKFNLDEIKVSAQRSPVTYSQVARIISVIEREEIEAAPVQSIQELLEYALSVDVRQRGVHGVQADISVRGGSFDQTLILLNGINISDPQTGHHNFNLPVSLKNISRVEILQGPAARVYGPNAFSGAINIITGENRGDELKLDVAYGEHNLLDLNAGYSFKTGKFKQFVAANRKSSDGYIDNTDFESNNIFYHGQLESEPGKLDVQLGYTQKGFGANSFYTPKYPNQYEKTKTTFASLQFETGKKLHFKPALYWRRLQDRFELFRDNPASWYKSHNYHLTDVLGSSLNAWFSSSLGKTAFGAEFRSENIWSNVLGEEMKEPIKVPGENGQFFTRSHSRSHMSYFVEHSLYLNKLSVSAGAMVNWISDLDFEWKVYPGIDVAYQLSRDVKIYSSVNTSMRMPTFTDLYYNGPTNVGNPDLKPEKSLTLEGGVKFNNGGIKAHLNTFYRKGKDMIDWVRKDQEEKWKTQNLTELNSFGIESGIDMMPEMVLGKDFFVKKIKLNYSYIQLDKGNNDYYSNYALDNLKHKFDVSVQHAIWKKLAANWQVSYQDRNGSYMQFEDGDYTGEVDYDPFWLVNLKLYWKHENIELYTSVSNLLDKKYNDIGNLRQPGRWFNFGVRYQVKFK